MAKLKLRLFRQFRLPLCAFATLLLLGGCSSYSAPMENAAGVQHQCASNAVSEIGRRMAESAMRNCRITLEHLGYLPQADIGETGIERLSFDLTGKVMVRSVAAASSAAGKVKSGARLLAIDGQRPGNPRYARRLLFGVSGEPVLLLINQDARKQFLRLQRAQRNTPGRGERQTE